MAGRGNIFSWPALLACLRTWAVLSEAIAVAMLLWQSGSGKYTTTYVCVYGEKTWACGVVVGLACTLLAVDVLMVCFDTWNNTKKKNRWLIAHDVIAIVLWFTLFLLQVILFKSTYDANKHAIRTAMAFSFLACLPFYVMHLIAVCMAGDTEPDKESVQACTCCVCDDSVRECLLKRKSYMPVLITGFLSGIGLGLTLAYSNSSVELKCLLVGKSGSDTYCRVVQAALGLNVALAVVLMSEGGSRYCRAIYPKYRLNIMRVVIAGILAIMNSVAFGLAMNEWLTTVSSSDQSAMKGPERYGAHAVLAFCAVATACWIFVSIAWTKRALQFRSSHWQDGQRKSKPTEVGFDNDKLFDDRRRVVQPDVQEHAVAVGFVNPQYTAAGSSSQVIIVTPAQSSHDVFRGPQNQSRHSVRSLQSLTSAREIQNPIPQPPAEPASPTRADSFPNICSDPTYLTNVALPKAITSRPRRQVSQSRGAGCGFLEKGNWKGFMRAETLNRDDCKKMKDCWRFVAEELDLEGTSTPNVFDHSKDKCYCRECFEGYDNFGKTVDYEVGQEHPYDWCSFGLNPRLMVQQYTNDMSRVDAMFGNPETGAKAWPRAYHGTFPKHVRSILKDGRLKKPGEMSAEGNEIRPVDGHFSATKQPTGGFDYKRVFLSASIRYCTCYCKQNPDPSSHMVAFQARVNPDTVTLGRETFGGAVQEGSIPSDQMEWIVDNSADAPLYRLFVRRTVDYA